MSEEVGYTVNQDNYGPQHETFDQEFNRIAMESNRSIIASNKAVIAHYERLKGEKPAPFYHRLIDHAGPIALWAIVLILLWTLVLKHG
jgi:hypothetical protein